MASASFREIGIFATRIKRFGSWGRAHKYERLPYQDGEANADIGNSQPGWEKLLSPRRLLVGIGMMLGSLLLVTWALLGPSLAQSNASCDTVDTGYQCQPDISQFWGQYSAYFSVPSNISSDVPEQCTVTFAQILSRHGARDPTSSKTEDYNATIEKIHASVTSYGAGYEFIKDYDYTLGADQLSVFGQQEMINSGIKYFNRYKNLTTKTDVFIRSSGQDRVVESAQNWTQGFHNARISAGGIDSDFPYHILIISEDAGSNNTLDHGLCTSFEEGFDNTIGNSAQAIFADIFTPNITARLNANLPGADLSTTETINLMSLCPFNTVANDNGAISPFCALFTTDEWKSYDYYQTLGKYYGNGDGNPLGPTQGVGFTNELIARLTGSAVVDHTSTNTTLDSSAETFPLNATLYADFTHDNDMTGIFSALGLFNQTAALSNTTVQSAAQTNGFSSSWIVPFSARAYFEKLKCGDQEEEFVRVVLNDRVIPLETCGADGLGLCTLDAFVDSLSFARAGGNWDQCFV